MVTDGKRIKEWADLPLEPGLVKSNTVIEEAELAAKIKQLFKTQKLKTKKINVGISGLHCLTRPIILPQLPKEMLDEAVIREARRVLPAPPEQLYISWQAVSTTQEGKKRIFLVAIPREMADALFKTLDRVGLKPSFMNLKPLLLTRVIKETEAVIVDVQATEFDIIIMADGIAQPVRTIPFLDETLSWQKKLTMISNELDRTITFHNSDNPEKFLSSDMPILVSGELADNSELCQALSDQLGHPVLSLESPLECPAGFAPSHYMANIGLSLQKLPSATETGSLVANLNTMPAPYRPKPISLVNIFALPSITIASILLAFLVIVTQSVSADIAVVRDRFNTTDQFVQQKQLQRQELVENIDELQKGISDAEAARDNFTAAIGSLEREGAGISLLLEEALKSLPKTIDLRSISYANNILTVGGWAPGESEVLLYINNLESSGGFGEITITNMSRIEASGMDFTLLGSLKTQDDTGSYIEVALSSLPANISLTNVSSTEGMLTINGGSPDEGEVLSYLQDLEASGRFLEITIASMTKNEEGGMDFSLILKTGE